MSAGKGILAGIAGLLLTLIVLVLNLAFYAALVAVVLWVALTILQHFGVLALGLGLIA